MSDYDHDDLVVDVADALALGQEVQWERCARLATPANRRALENLRALSGMFTVGRTDAGDAWPSWAASKTEPYAGGLVRLAVYALITFAALQVVAALALALWGWGDFHREYGEYAVYMATLLVGYSLTACLFLFGGRHDRRTWLLGVYFLLKATLVNPFMLLGFLLGVPPTEPFGFPNFGYPYVYPFLFAPAFLWAFARECPRVHRRTRLDDLARRMVLVSVVIGCFHWVAGNVWVEVTRAGYVDPAVFWVGFDAVLATSNLLVLGAVVVVVLRAHAAPADEARRVALFSIGFLMCTGLGAGYDVIETFSPGGWPSNFRWSPVVVLVALLRFPGIALLWYSVLAVRVPHLREAIRASCRRLLRRGRLLGVVAASPVLALGWLVASRPERPVGAALGDPLVQSLAAAAGALLLVVAARERILVRVDDWIFPEVTDQRQAVARAAAGLAQAGGTTAVSRTVDRAAKRGCGSPATLLVAADTESATHDFVAPDAKMAPLAQPSAIVHILETAGGSLRVHPNDKTSFFSALPRDDAAWVVESGADAIVPVPGPGAELLGVLVVGRRLDGRIVRPVDIPFLEALAAAAGLAVARLRLLQRSGSRAAGGAARPGVPRVSLRDRARRDAGVRLPGGLCRDGGPKAPGGQVSTDAASGMRRDGDGLSGARPAARARRRGQDPEGHVGLAADGTEAGGVGHGDGDASGGDPDPRHRVVAGPAVPRRRVPGRRHPRGPPSARAVAGARGGLGRRDPGRRARGAPRDKASARRRQAEQRRADRERIAEADGLRPGPQGDRHRHKGRHPELPVAGGAVRPPGGGGRRCLVPVRHPVRNGVG